MGERMVVNQEQPSSESVQRAISVLSEGGVVVIPTDSVYGIACAATPGNPAHERIFSIKRRELCQKLPLLIGSPEELEQLADELPEYAKRLAKKFWPGALTLVVKASDALPPEYVSPDGTVALRCPDSAFVRQVVQELKTPLACTSANTHGAKAPGSFACLEERISNESDLVCDAGAAPLQVASTIVKCVGETPEILREGALSFKEVLDV